MTITTATCHLCERPHEVTAAMRIGSDGRKLSLRAAVALAHYYGPRAAAPVCHLCGGTHEVTDAMHVDSDGRKLSLRAALEVAHYYHATVATAEKEAHQAIMARKFPGCSVDFFAQVTDDHAEDFARVEADLPEGKEFFLIVRGKFANEDEAFAALRDKLEEHLSA